MPRPRLILHAGTPKTGTTSVQWFMDEHRQELVERGVLYPALEPGDPGRKHQWLVDALLGERAGGILPKLTGILDSAPEGVHTVILSTEGIFNWWWEFTAFGRAELAALAEQVEVEIWVWFRDPVSFARSKYIQILRNSPGASPLYGTGLTFEEVLDDAWFSRGLDYIGFIEDVDALMGAKTAKPFVYDGNVLPTLLGHLGVASIAPAAERRNQTPTARSVHLIRAVNRSGVVGRRRDIYMRLVQLLDSIDPLPHKPLPVTVAAQRRISKLAAPSLTALRDTYGLSLVPDHAGHSERVARPTLT